VSSDLLEKDHFGVDIIGQKVSITVYLWSVDFGRAGTYGRGHADLHD
jgi:hypothetical protein